MGLPMVIACPAGEATDIIAGTSSGVVVEPENPEALANCIAGLYSDRPRLAELASASGMSAKGYDRARQAALMLDALR
jgi:glycosyltransferase involved in cell wall biosynthesis